MRWTAAMLTASTMTAASVGTVPHEYVFFEEPPTIGQEVIYEFSSEWLEQFAKEKAHQEYLEEKQEEIKDLQLRSVGLDIQMRIEKEQRAANAELVQARLDEANQYLGETPYILGGSSPNGWDCSGFTMWFFEELGIELPHSASQQSSLGREVTQPRPGDLVFYGNNDVYHHVGIYVGDDVVIHSGYREGYRTELIPTEDPRALASQIKFVRFIETE